MVVPTPSSDPLSYRRTPVPDAWTHPDQDRSTYLTTEQVAKLLGDVSAEQVHRWCRRWFGPLPRGRRGKGLGYRLPLEYERVARVWRKVEDVQVREVAKRALLANPRNWVVVVGNVGSTHYSAIEAANRVEQVTKLAEQSGAAIYVVPTFKPRKR